MNFWICILAWLTIGWICSQIAFKRGRNPSIWFILGALLGLVALLLLFILPSNAPKLATSPATLPVEPSLIPTEDHVHTPPETLWHFIDQEKSIQGPISFYALKEAWEAGQISAISYVWNEGMENWQKIGDLPDLLIHIQE